MTSNNLQREMDLHVEANSQTKSKKLNLLSVNKVLYSVSKI